MNFVRDYFRGEEINGTGQLNTYSEREGYHRPNVSDKVWLRRLKAMDDRRFTVVLRAEDTGGYSVQCVEPPQVISQGETKEEALANVKEAIELVLEHLAEKASAQKGYVKIRYNHSGYISWGKISGMDKYHYSDSFIIRHKGV